MRKLWLWFTALALLLGGCGGEPSRSIPWTELTFHLSGGIAGFDRQVTLAAGGTFTVTERGKSTVKGKLGSADLKRLKASVVAVPWPDLQPTYTDPKVADAIMEAVSLVSPAKSYSTVVGTGGAPPAQLSDLLALLRQVGK